MTSPVYQTSNLTLQNFAISTTSGAVTASSGNTIIAIANQGTNQTVTFADSQGTYTNFFPTALSSGSNFGYWTGAYLYNANAGSHTITATLGTSAATTQLIVLVYSGGQLTGTAAVNGAYGPSGANSFNSGTITPAVNGSTIIGVGWNPDLTETVTVGTSGVSFTNEANSPAWWLIEDYSQPTAAAQAAYFGITGTSTQSCQAFVLALAPYASGNTATIAWIT